MVEILHSYKKLSLDLSFFFLTRFLLPYERHTKGQEEKEIKRRESESGSEKVLFLHYFRKDGRKNTLMEFSYFVFSFS